LSGATIEDFLSGFEGGGGVGDFFFSEFFFSSAFSLLFFIEVVVSDLFVDDGFFEFIQHFGDLVKGTTVFH
jgi:hypothetical protein